MLRVSATLICVLAARLGLAARQNLKAGQSGALATVVDKIDALIQAKDNSGAHSKALDTIRSLVAITPGHEQAFNDALRQVITDIEANVDSKITAGFKSSQEKVHRAVADLEVATSSALELKAQADAVDQTWFESVAHEKSLRVAVEVAVAASHAADAATVTPCQQQEESKMFQSDPMAANPLDFSCDFSVLDDCAKKRQAYNEMVNGIVTALGSNLQEATQTWTTHKLACDAAMSNADAKQLARDMAISDWSSERDNRKKYHEQRQLGLCTFGQALQRKCDIVVEYNDQLERVGTSGSADSEVDRQSEWKTTSVTKCMLLNVINGVDLDAATLATCDNNVDYEGLVGIFNREEDRFATLTSETSFSCSDQQTITFFNGEMWNVPMGDEPASSEYTTGPFHADSSNGMQSEFWGFCTPEVGWEGEPTCGGTAPDGARCHFPFTYGSNSYSDCTTAGSFTLNPWCYTAGGAWGNCNCEEEPKEPVEPGPPTCGGNAAGAPCQFPFSHNFVEYKDCIMEGHEEAWCSTGFGTWGNCNCPEEPIVPTTCGGTAQGAKCHFPFTYLWTDYSSCISDGHDQPWCETESGAWGNCNCENLPGKR